MGPSRNNTEQRSDEGSGTVIALGLAGVVGILAIGAVTLSGAQIARHKAQNAADLAALSAADVLLGRAAGQACQAGAETAKANRATLTSCEISGSEAKVAVAVKPVGVHAGFAYATARAGPPGR